MQRTWPEWWPFLTKGTTSTTRAQLHLACILRATRSHETVQSASRRSSGTMCPRGRRMRYRFKVQ